MKRVQHIDVALSIRNHNAPWREEDKLPMRHGELLAVRRSEGEGDETAAQTFSDVFNRHNRKSIARAMKRGQDDLT
jgi:hypothetical protein